MLYTPLLLQSRTACLQRASTRPLTGSMSSWRFSPQSTLQTLTRSQFSTINGIKGINPSLLPRPSTVTLASRPVLRYGKLFQAAGLAGLGLTVSLLTTPVVHCERKFYKLLFYPSLQNLILLVHTNLCLNISMFGSSNLLLFV